MYLEWIKILYICHGGGECFFSVIHAPLSSCTSQGKHALDWESQKYAPCPLWGWGEDVSEGWGEVDESTVRSSGEFSVGREVSAASTCRDHRIQPRNLRDIGFDRWGNWGTGRKGNVPKVVLVGESWIQAEFGFLYSASESSFHRILYAEVSPGNLGYGTFAGTDQSGELWALIAKNSQVRSRGREVGTMATPPPPPLPRKLCSSAQFLPLVWLKAVPTFLSLGLISTETDSDVWWEPPRRARSGPLCVGHPYHYIWFSLGLNGALEPMRPHLVDAQSL